nr:hypothetical protein CoNPh37_CDS0084 [Staphylococcus phage S-CoN_Ph37]
MFLFAGNPSSFKSLAASWNINCSFAKNVCHLHP